MLRMWWSLVIRFFSKSFTRSIVSKMAKKFETPKGTRDFLPEEMRLRSVVFDKLRHAFSLFGYDELDTPAFEYLEVLTLKAGPQAENEIYSFKDKSDRSLGLRFDLTSSTGRFAANHPELKRPIYRYQIGKVWRYDRPAAGRYREFYQADADILGSYSMDCEVELLLLADFVLKEFGLNQSVFLVNHRKILDAQIRLAGIPSEKKAQALRAIDKLDKIGVDGIIEEAIKYEIEKPQFLALIDLLGISSNTDAALETSDYLRHIEPSLSQDEVGALGLKEIRHILSKANDLGFGNRLKIEPTLARGLDYYTGPIFEARAGVGQGLLSFAGGGRYDDLIGLYGGQPQGAVGFSFGVERLIDLLQTQGHPDKRSQPVLIGPVGEGQMVAAEEVAMTLRHAQIPTRVLVGHVSPGKHLQYAEAIGANWMIFVGEKEEKEQRYPLKDLSARSEKTLSLAEIIKQIRP